MKNIVVLYHNYCPDGFGAAWAAWKKFGNRADYIGVVRGEQLPRGLHGKEVYTLDFCYDEPMFSELKRKAKRLVVLDHHITRKEATMSADDYRFSLSQSGAGISWDYFHPKKPIPCLLKHIQDYDLWRFSVPHTRAVNAILSTYPFEFVARDIFSREFENSKKRNEFIKQGYAILKYQKQVVEKSVALATLVSFAGHKVLAANSFTLTSEIGQALHQKKQPFGIIWSERQGRIFVSLRSQKGFDVGKIATRFGGGGHTCAAAFNFLVSKSFPWKRIKK